MLPDLVQPTPYPEINAVLEALATEAQAILGRGLVGVYMVGSLSMGDFDPQRSDIDLIIVTDAPVEERRFLELREMHARLSASGSRWSSKIDAVYAPRAALGNDASFLEAVPVLEAGCPLTLQSLETGWSVQCYNLRAHGRALLGPKPQTLVEAVDPERMRRAGKEIAEIWRDEARTDLTWLDWLRERENQQFVVLTLCRLLYTLETDTVTSKPGAARWAQQALDGRWQTLIDTAARQQPDQQTLTADEEAETLALVQYTVDRFSQWADSVA